MGEATAITAGEGAVYDLAGAVHRIVLDGTQTGGAAALVEIEVAPGAGAPPHTDEREDIFWYVVEGTLDFETGSGPVSVGAGGALTCPRGSVHTFANTGDAPAKVLLLAVPAGVEGFFRDAAEVLPPGVPAGPPPPEAVAALAEVASRYGITLQLPPG